MEERFLRYAWPFIGLLLFHSVGCGNSNTPPHLGRFLLSITVTPSTADARNYSNGQVQFAASGTFNEAPSPGPLTFTPPYTGGFSIADPSIATIVSTGTATVTVQCVAGASGTANVVATASSNGGLQPEISGTAQLTCP